MARDIGVPGVVEWEDRIWAKRMLNENQQLKEQQKEQLRELRELAAKCDEKFQAIGERFDGGDESVKEAMGRVHSRVEKLELEVKTHNQQADDRNGELRTSSRSVIEFLQRRFTSEELSSIDLIQLPSSDVPLPARTLNHDDQRRGSIGSPLINNRGRSQPRVAVRKSSYVVPQTPVNPSALNLEKQHVTKPPSNPVVLDNELFNKPSEHDGNDIYGPTMNHRKRPTATRPTFADPPRASPLRTRSRSRTESSENRSAAPASPVFVPGPPKIPKLSQNRRPLMAYYEEATAIRDCLNLEVGQPEYDFVSAFIDGISIKKIASRLFDSLANFCDSGAKADGSRYVYCEWEEVLEAIKLAGLDIVQTVQDKGKGRADKATIEDPGLSSKDADQLVANKKQPATTSRGRNKTKGRDPHWSNKHFGLTGHGFKNSTSATIGNASSGKVRFDPTIEASGAAARPSKGKGNVAARRPLAQKPAASTSKADERTSAKGGRITRATVEKPGPGTVTTISDLEMAAGDTEAESGIGATESTNGTGRRSRPRKAKG